MAQISRQCLTIPLGPSARSAITWTHHPKIIGKTVVPLTWVPLCNQPHIHLSGYLLGVPPTRGNSTAGRPSQGGPEPYFPYDKRKVRRLQFLGCKLQIPTEKHTNPFGLSPSPTKKNRKYLPKPQHDPPIPRHFLFECQMPFPSVQSQAIWTWRCFLVFFHFVSQRSALKREL